MRIKEIKLSLMEKDTDNSVPSIEGKENYIIRNSATFNVEEYIDKVVPKEETIVFDDEFTVEEFNDFISEALRHIYGELLSVSGADYDAVGIWINTDEGEFDNSLKLSVINDLEKYGADDVNPVFELYKMTLEQYADDVSI